MQNVSFFYAISVLGSVLSLGACDVLGSQSCTEVACGGESIGVEFTFTEPGAYVFEVDVDGKTSKCTATLPLDIANSGCDDDTMGLTQSGSALSADQHSIGPLQIVDPDAKHVEVKAFRDGNPVGTAAFDVTHTTTPGPNGPDCEPEVCRQASGGTLK